MAPSYGRASTSAIRNIRNQAHGGPGRPDLDKKTLTTAAARYVANPIVKLVAGRLPYWALLETRGRKSGEARRTPVTNGLDGNTLWIVAEHGHSADYVRNIEADPRVRVFVGGRWRNGVARLLEDDDPILRQRSIGRRFNSAMVRAAGTELLTVRIDLEA